MKILSVFTKNLNNQTIKKICKLKNSHWKFGFKSQIKYFKNNLKKNDIHNLIIKDNELIAYTALRNLNLFINKKKIRYLRFDTLIINKKFRGKGYSNKIMELNNTIIKNKKKPSILVCKKNMVKFYSNHGWVIIKKNRIKITKNLQKNFMIYNKILNNKSIFLF
tara:strand:- start:123 stop:614 length:492 start_codon:yes stop_codon:yes gene_type:complete